MLLGAAGRIPGDWRNITSEGLRVAASDGFAVLNVVVNDPSELKDSDVDRLKRMFDEAGLEIGQTNGRYRGGLVSPDEAQRDASIEFAKECVG